MEIIEYYKNLKEGICCCVFDIQQFFLFSDITGEPVSHGVSLRSWFIYTTSGKGTALVDKTDYPLERGSLVTLHPGAVFSITPGKREKLSYYAIGFAYKNGFCAEGRKGPSAPLTGYHKLTNTIRVETLLKDMHRFSMNGNLNTNPELTCAFYNLMTSFWEDIRSGLNNMSIYKRIEKATDFIHENFNQKICTEDLAGKCGISKEYFIRVFKDYTGVTPGRFIIDLRMNRAKEILMAGNCKVKETALLVGYKDEFYFSKLFKKMVGTPPRYYSAKNIY